jgi:iron complex outermembrane recepter protein
VRCPGGTPAAGAIASQDCGAGTTSVFSVGNKGIQPEKSQSYNFGFILEPSKTVNVAVDFWQIVRKNEIIGADAQAVLNNPNGYAGASITRDSTNGLVGIANSGTVLAVSAPYLNGPSTKTNGVDLDLRFKASPFENGVRMSGGMNVSYTKTFQRTMPDGTVLDYAGTYGPTALSSSAGMPRARAVFDLTGQSGPWSVTGRMNYVSAIKVVESQQDQTCLAHDSAGNDFGNGCKVPAFTTFDVFASYKINKAFEVSGSIQNLFDKVASFDPQASYGLTHYNPSYSMAGVIGRYFRVTAKYKFD